MFIDYLKFLTMTLKYFYIFAYIDNFKYKYFKSTNSNEWRYIKVSKFQNILKRNKLYRE